MTEQLAGLDAFQDVQRALVLAAHPDDMETLMGGTVLRLREQGVAFTAIICTAGDIGSNDPRWTAQSLAATRVTETEHAAQLLGIAHVEIMGHRDGELEASLALRAEIARYYRLYQPDTLFTFDPTGWVLNHPDHRAAGRAALDALIPASMRLYHPSQLTGDAHPSAIKRIFLWTAAAPDVFVDVAGVYDAKMAACLAHASQFPEPARLDWMRRMDGERGQRIGATYAESFQALRTY